ncbi:cytoplasmic dynein 1 intermediate chain 1-like, partial [Leptonychotes weddellii]|uniref:Cytoplasmic dynein 1 intermediate chain 1-like n=1 Tax=Leptonychotes weddellii TaxID=9713 RepID=A0A7F8QF55_LEPWE
MGLIMTPSAFLVLIPVKEKAIHTLVKGMADMQQKKEPVQDDSDLDRKRRETEALLQSIGISPEPPLVPTPMSPSSKSVSTPSEAGSQDSGDLGPLTRTLQWDTDPSVLQLQSDSELG